MFNKKRLEELETRLNILEDMFFQLYNSYGDAIKDAELCECGCYVELEEGE